MSFFLLLNTKEDIWKYVGNQTVDVTHSRTNQWCPKTVWLQHSSKYLPLKVVFIRTNIYTGLELLEGE